MSAIQKTISQNNQNKLNEQRPPHRGILCLVWTDTLLQILGFVSDRANLLLLDIFAFYFLHAAKSRRYSKV